MTVTDLSEWIYTGEKYDRLRKASQLPENPCPPQYNQVYSYLLNISWLLKLTHTTRNSVLSIWVLVPLLAWQAVNIPSSLWRQGKRSRYPSSLSSAQVQTASRQGCNQEQGTLLSCPLFQVLFWTEPVGRAKSFFWKYWPIFKACSPNTPLPLPLVHPHLGNTGA